MLTVGNYEQRVSLMPYSILEPPKLPPSSSRLPSTRLQSPDSIVIYSYSYMLVVGKHRVDVISDVMTSLIARFHVKSAPKCIISTQKKIKKNFWRGAVPLPRPGVSTTRLSEIRWLSIVIIASVNKTVHNFVLVLVQIRCQIEQTKQNETYSVLLIFTYSVVSRCAKTWKVT